MMRTTLYEAAQVMLLRSAKWSWLKAWAMKIARHRGMKKAIVALAQFCLIGSAIGRAPTARCARNRRGSMFQEFQQADNAITRKFPADSMREAWKEFCKEKALSPR
jgi:hypothetical protein